MNRYISATHFDSDSKTLLYFQARVNININVSMHVDHNSLASFISPEYINRFRVADIYKLL